MPTEEENLHAILNSTSYILAEQDPKLLARRELRPVRMQLELLKPELALVEHNVTSTIVVFGGTRIAEPAEAKRRLELARAELAVDPTDRRLQRNVARAERLLEKSCYYDAAREFAAVRAARDDEVEAVDSEGSEEREDREIHDAEGDAHSSLVPLVTPVDPRIVSGL